MFRLPAPRSATRTGSSAASGQLTRTAIWSPTGPYAVESSSPPAEPSNDDPVPDLAVPPWFITTGADGIATLRGPQIQVPGAFQYRATLGSSTGRRLGLRSFLQSAGRFVIADPPGRRVRSIASDRMQHFFMTGRQRRGGATRPLSELETHGRGLYDICAWLEPPGPSPGMSLLRPSVSGPGLPFLLGGVR